MYDPGSDSYPDSCSLEQSCRAKFEHLGSSETYTFSSDILSKWMKKLLSSVICCYISVIWGENMKTHLVLRLYIYDKKLSGPYQVVNELNATSTTHDLWNCHYSFLLKYRSSIWENSKHQWMLPEIFKTLPTKGFTFDSESILVWRTVRSTVSS